MAPKLAHSRRAALRYKLPHKKITYMSKGQLGEAILKNISTSGCCAHKNTTELAVKDQLLVVIELAESDKPLELKAKVVRVDDHDFSAQFTDLEESFLPHFSTMLAIEHRYSITHLAPILK
jgi:hypothetical protein